VKVLNLGSIVSSYNSNSLKTGTLAPSREHEEEVKSEDRMNTEDGTTGSSSKRPPLRHLLS
jgi:hypothetical protein